MANPRSFTVDAITPPLSALHDLDQDYEVFGPRAIARKMSGRGTQQGVWSKLRTNLSGKGWIPAGLESLDLLIPHTLLCAAPRAIQSASHAIALPAGRRTDGAEFLPQGLAILADGRVVDTHGVLAGDVLTLTPVTGASRYQARYWPALDVFITTLRNRTDLRGNTVGWEIVAEEM